MLNSRRQATSPQPSKAGLLIGLMVPVMMTALNFSVFSVVIPTIRKEFQIEADQAAWLLTAYMLPFTIFMPLYGRLGDALGKRRLFLTGIAVFMLGTTLTLIAPNLVWLIAGWATQGLGAAGIAPLAMAIISQLVPVAERGRTLGTWSSTAPVMGIIAPVLGGLIIQYLGWRIIFGPVLLVGLIAFLAVWLKLPAIPGAEQTPFTFLRRFDWVGVALLTLAVTGLIFYTSSRPITGVAALQDWRLLILSLLFLASFITQERRRINPFVRLNIFAQRTFTVAALCSGIRLFALNGTAFVIPLYLTDIYHLPPATTGMILTIHSGALLLTLRLGGQWADRWGSRWLTIISLSTQAVLMLTFALFPAATSLWLICMALIIHGLGAGLSMAPLDRVALNKVSQEQAGVAAGLYNMIRIGGFVIGTALAGVILQYGLDTLAAPISAYQLSFACMAGVAFLGGLSSLGLKE
jgi:EmrB/QacA subfamily drug resistance transporter